MWNLCFALVVVSLLMVTAMGRGRPPGRPGSPGHPGRGHAWGLQKGSAGQGMGKRPHGGGGPPESKVIYSGVVTGGETRPVNKLQEFDQNIYESNRRHRRALDLLSEEVKNETPEDTNPCALHSIRYGCLCRAGDKRCPYLEDEPFFFRDFNFLPY